MTKSPLLLLLMPAVATAQLSLSSHDTGSGLLSSFGEVQVSSRNAGDIDQAAVFGLPATTTISASVIGANASDTYDWTGARFLIESAHTKQNGSFTVSRGFMVFEVLSPASYVLEGSYQVSSANVQETQFRARWEDLTTATLLYESIQSHAAGTNTYVLGGLVGNRHASLFGSAGNSLVVGHVYRVDWASSIENFAPGSADASAIGAISLSPIPEPATWLSLSVGLVPMLWGSLRRRGEA